MTTTTTDEPLIRIPRGARGAILKFFEDEHVHLDEVLDYVYMHAGFADRRDLVKHVRETYGEAEAEALKERAGAEMEIAVEERLGSAGMMLSGRTTAGAVDDARRDAEPRALLLHMPDALFATAIEGACERQAYAWGNYDKVRPIAETEEFVNARLAQVGAPYLLDDDTVNWVGDQGIDEIAIRPAIRALEDDRLATAAEDFAHAMRDLRTGTKRSLKDAVGYATKALEGAQVAVLEAHAHDLPEKRQVALLWRTLCAAEPALAPNMNLMTELIISSVRVRNEKGQHSDPRPISQIEAEVSVVAVANAINYLATLLPTD